MPKSLSFSLLNKWMKPEYERTPVDRPSGLFQEYIQSQMKKILLSEEILVTVLIDWYGQPTFIKQNWEEYWTPVTPVLSSRGLQILDDLRKAHRQYIISKFHYEHMIEYCFRYFCLLEEVLSVIKNICDDKSRSTLLRKVLGLENFSIRWTDGLNGVACGTSTIRNPCYLLVKVKQPAIYDDPKFLAIITGPGISDEASLFYHYRQYKIDDEIGISVLLYPAVVLSERVNSFALIESFTMGFSGKSDPRTRQRSQILADLAISPFLSGLFSKASIDCAQEIDFVDIGSGDGALVSSIWRRILKTQPYLAQNCKMACSMIGLRVQNPLRHFNRGSLQGTISYLDYCQVDYIQWIQQQTPIQEEFKFDVALVCRLLNNLSIFELDFSDNWQVIHKLGEEGLNKAIWICRKFEPHNCLNPDNRLTESVFLKSSNVLLKTGKSFRHLSLSNYYKGLKLLSSKDNSMDHVGEAVYFPVRRFNGACLQLRGGESALEKLCNLAKLVVIEDVDLTKKELIEHLVEFSLENIAASCVSKYNRVNSASVFCLSHNQFADLLPGKRIW